MLIRSLKELLLRTQNSLDSFALHGTASAVGRRSSIQEEFSTQEDYCTESRSSTHLNFSSLLTSTPSGRSSNNLESTHNRRRSGPCELTAPATATGHHSLAAFADPRGFKSLNGFLQARYEVNFCFIAIQLGRILLLPALNGLVISKTVRERRVNETR